MILFVIIECNYVAHHYCQKNVPAECQTTSHQIAKTPAEELLLNNLQQQAYPGNDNSDNK